MNKAYFFDTYAFFEIINGNPSYATYNKALSATTTYNLMELHYGLILSYGKEFADKKYDEFRPICTDVDDRIIKTANEFRAKNKKKRFSYIDCIGYITARINGMVFLTGDKGFERMENVEFVK